MILGIGIDVVRADRRSGWLEKQEVLDRFFHSDEIASVKKKGESSILSLAARFAAKEAFGKALGTGLRGFGLKEIRVSNNSTGMNIRCFFHSASIHLTCFTPAPRHPRIGACRA